MCLQASDFLLVKKIELKIIPIGLKPVGIIFCNLVVVLLFSSSSITTLIITSKFLWGGRERENEIPAPPPLFV